MQKLKVWKSKEELDQAWKEFSEDTYTIEELQEMEKQGIKLDERPFWGKWAEKALEMMNECNPRLVDILTYEMNLEAFCKNIQEEASTLMNREMAKARERLASEKGFLKKWQELTYVQNTVEEIIIKEIIEPKIMIEAKLQFPL